MPYHGERMRYDNTDPDGVGPEKGVEISARADKAFFINIDSL